MNIIDRDYAIEKDKQDPLASYRAKFHFDDSDLIYLDGNSLGRLPIAGIQLIRDLVETSWGERLIRGWNDGWFTAQQDIGGKIAQLVGAQADEVALADSTSVNLYKLAVAALQKQEGRRAIVTDDLNFPSDIYILQGAINTLGNRHQLKICPSPDGIHGATEAILAALDEDVALVALTHAVFKSGYIYDMEAISAAAHAVGAMVLWDTSHSVGSIPVDLNGANADLAVGCVYKYLNGGPGGPAFLYVRQDLQEQLHNPISGWIGEYNPFDFQLSYRPGVGIRRFLTGTPPVLSTMAVEPGVDMLLDAGMDRVRAKSIEQTEYLVGLWEAWLAEYGFRLNAPHDAGIRGSHVSLGHDDGWRISQALINEMAVLPDFRPPDNIRLGIAPLYTSFEDIYEAMSRLRQVMAEELYENYQLDRAAVT